MLIRQGARNTIGFVDERRGSRGLATLAQHVRILQPVGYGGHTTVRCRAFQQRLDPPAQIGRIEHKRKLGSEELDLLASRRARDDRVGSRCRAFEMPFEHVEPNQQTLDPIVIRRGSLSFLQQHPGFGVRSQVEERTDQ